MGITLNMATPDSPDSGVDRAKGSAPAITVD
ncbi:MAG: hypothetical protein ACI9ME_000903, partial [Ilumatobacter sp.]